MLCTCQEPDPIWLIHLLLIKVREINSLETHTYAQTSKVWYVETPSPLLPPFLPIVGARATNSLETRIRTYVHTKQRMQEPEMTSRRKKKHNTEDPTSQTSVGTTQEEINTILHEQWDSPHASQAAQLSTSCVRSPYACCIHKKSPSVLLGDPNSLTPLLPLPSLVTKATLSNTLLYY